VTPIEGEIQRYRMEFTPGSGGWIKVASRGEWVAHADHLAEVERLEARIQELEPKLKRKHALLMYAVDGLTAADELADAVEKELFERSIKSEPPGYGWRFAKPDSDTMGFAAAAYRQAGIQTSDEGAGTSNGPETDRLTDRLASPSSVDPAGIQGEARDSGDRMSQTWQLGFDAGHSKAIEGRSASGVADADLVTVTLTREEAKVLTYADHVVDCDEALSDTYDRAYDKLTAALSEGKEGS
jgi:hypothetical protein